MIADPLVTFLCLITSQRCWLFRDGFSGLLKEGGIFSFQATSLRKSPLIHVLGYLHLHHCFLCQWEKEKWLWKTTNSLHQMPILMKGLKIFSLLPFLKAETAPSGAAASCTASSGRMELIKAGICRTLVIVCSPLPPQEVPHCKQHLSKSSC